MTDLHDAINNVCRSVGAGGAVSVSAETLRWWAYQAYSLHCHERQLEALIAHNDTALSQWSQASHNALYALEEGRDFTFLDDEEVAQIAK